jgi:glutamate synthase domain-containing protein 2
VGLVRRGRCYPGLCFDAALDVVKALCLGARAVGLGRAFLYAQSVRRMFDSYV